MCLRTPSTPPSFGKLGFVFRVVVTSVVMVVGLPVVTTVVVRRAPVASCTWTGGDSLVTVVVDVLGCCRVMVVVVVWIVVESDG